MKKTKRRREHKKKFGPKNKEKPIPRHGPPTLGRESPENRCGKKMKIGPFPSKSLKNMKGTRIRNGGRWKERDKNGSYAALGNGRRESFNKENRRCGRSFD